jgi:uridine kinase
VSSVHSAASLVAKRIGELSRTGPLLVAIDGRSGSGKSTLSRQLERLLDAAVVEGDDFYRDLPDDRRRTIGAAQDATRFFDFERLQAEALQPLLDGRQARYHPYDWVAGEGLSADLREVAPRPIVILDQVYSGHPLLRDLVDLAVVVVTEDARRLQRIAARGAANASWHALWEAAEVHYFTTVRPAGTFDVVVDGAAVSDG